MPDDPKRRPGQRHQTATERDLEGMAARRDREREREAAAREGVPHIVTDDVTGQYTGDELKEHRAKRPTDQRVAHLEIKHDTLAATVVRIEVAQGLMTGKVDTILDFAAKADAEREARAQRDAVEREAKRLHIVPIIKAIGIALAVIAAAVVGHGV